MWRVIMLFTAAALVVAATRPAEAARTIFKCVRNGQVILADHPCEIAPPEASTPTTVGASGTSPPTPVGTWRGDLQFQAQENGRDVAAARRLAPLTLELFDGGRVTGSSPDSGCQLAGTWSLGGGPRVIALDVELTECRSNSSNRRYSGALIMSAADSSADVSLVSGTPAAAGQAARTYGIKGTVRQPSDRLSP